MASIIERGGRFFVRVRRNGHPTAAKTFTTRKDAAAWGKRVEVAMESGRWKAELAPSPTLAEAISDYRASVVAKLKGSATYGYWLDELAASSLGAMPVNAIASAHLSRWRDAQAVRLAPGTVNRKLGLLSGLLTWCVKDRGWLPSNPLHSVRKPRVSDARDRIVAPDELQLIQNAANTSRAAWLADALAVLLTSAMRRGELWGLRPSDVDFDNATAHLADTKNGSARDVPLCPVALAALRRLADQAEKRGDSALIPVASAHAVSLAFRRTLDRARRQYEADCTASGREAAPDFLADLRLHDFRHHAVTAWAATGALTLPELAAVSGHKSPRMLMRYVNLSASALAAKLAAISAPHPVEAA